MELGTILLAVLVALLPLTLLLRTQKSAGKKPLPPGPAWSWPVLRVIPSLGPHLHKDLSRFAKQYGPIVHFKIGRLSTVLISSPDLARELLLVKDAEFCDRFEMAALTEVFHNFHGIGSGQYSDSHIRLRKICNTELVTKARIKAFEPVLRQDGTAMVKSIYDEIIENGGQAAAVTMRTRLSAFAANVATQIACRRRFHGAVVEKYDPAKLDLREDSPMDLQNIVPLLSMVMELLGTVNIGDYIPFLKSLNLQGFCKKGRLLRIQIDKVLSELIREHREFHQQNPELIKSSEHVKDYLDVLLLLQQEERLTEAHIKGSIMDVLLGSNDALTATIEWALTLLIRHPGCMNQAHEEMDRVVGRDRLVEEADLPNLPFLRAIFKETARFNPTFPVPAPRVNSEEAELGGYRIPKNSCVFVHSEDISLNPSLWKNPLEFNPHPFVQTDNVDFQGKRTTAVPEELQNTISSPNSTLFGELQANNDNFSLLTFGAGRRGCPGRKLGIATVTYALAVLVQSFDWGPPPGQKAEDINMSEGIGVARFKAVPLITTATPRLAPSVYTRLNKAER